MALLANPGTDVMLGSSGPEQRRAVCSEFDYNQQVTQAEFSSSNGKNIICLLGDSESCGPSRIIGINPYDNNIKLLVYVNLGHAAILN
jgi:hypothetical protein